MFTAGRICPQCGYARQPEDFAPEYECPRCGFIYATCRPTVPSDLAVVAGISAADLPPCAFGSLPDERFEADTLTVIPSSHGEARPASLKRRALAAIYTGSLALLVMIPLKLCVYAAIRITHPPGSIKTFADLAALRSLENAYYFVLALVVIYAFFLRPLIAGATWGQQKFGLTIRDAAWEEWPPTLQVHLLRFAGQLIALAALPLTLTALLFGLVTNRNFPGIADRLSLTRQDETAEPLPPILRAIHRAIMPACIALLVQLTLVGPLSHWMMKGYLDQPLRRINQSFSRMTESASPIDGALAWAGTRPARSVTAAATPASAPAAVAARPSVALRQNSLGFLTNLQRRHLNERGRYTADLETLVMEYGADLNQSDEILRLIQQDAIRARMTGLGIELWVKLASGEWRRVELQG